MKLKILDADGGGFRLIEIIEVHFRRIPIPSVRYRKVQHASGAAPFDEIEEVLRGPVFVMNDKGDTIESYRLIKEGRKVA